MFTERTSGHEATTGEQVRVGDVHVRRSTHPVGGLTRSVCASIHLGAHCPSEVTVELHLEEEPGGSVSGSAPRGMWSAHAHGDGAYAFVAHLSAAELARARRLTVTVKPARPATSGAEVYARSTLRVEDCSGETGTAPAVDG